jgi:hypothetical protein
MRCQRRERDLGRLKKLIMNLLNFFKTFPDEASAKAHFKVNREKEGVICKKCCGERHWWLESKEMWECKDCRTRMSLKSGSVMENSKLPFLYWYIAMHLMSATKKGFSALEMQRQIGHKRYQPIWALMHKLRMSMANRDEKHLLKGEIELDEAFFTAMSEEKSDEPQKRGAGSQRMAKVLVMAESKPVAQEKKYKKAFKCGYFKMFKIDDLQAETITQETLNGVLPEETEVRSDNSKSHVGLVKIVKSHKPKTLPGKEGSTALPWVHTCISNAKRFFLGTYHMISEKYLQNYLSEYCYMLNRRYHGQRLFDRLVLAATYHWK